KEAAAPSSAGEEIDGPPGFPRPMQPQHDEMGVIWLCEPLRGLAAAAVPGAPRPADPVALPQQMPPALAVSGPQRGAQGRAKKRAGDHPGHDDWTPVIEPDEVRRAPPDPVAHEAVIAVGDPGLGLDRRSHAADEFVRIVPGQVAPPR